MIEQPVPISKRIGGLRPTAVNSILAEVRALPSPPVSLMRGEPDFRTPDHIREAAMRALNAGRTGYPDNRGEVALRQAVAAKLTRDNGVSYDPATEILITPGATFGIYAALAALLNEGDEVLLPDPVYDAYQSPIRLCGAVPVAVESAIRSGRFSLAPENLERVCTERTRVLLLNTPWNPVGTVFTRHEIEEIGAFCQRRNLALISDEIYESIVFDGHLHTSPPSLSTALRDRTVLVNALTKTYAMPGWRVGYCAAPSHVIQAMFLVLQQSSRGPATFVQDAAAEALSGPQDCVLHMREEYARRLSLVYSAIGTRVLRPEGGFFAMVDVRDLGSDSNAIRRRLLNEFGVVVVHGAAYGPCGEGTLRVSFASGGDTLAHGLERLRAGLEAMA